MKAKLLVSIALIGLLSACNSEQNQTTDSSTTDLNELKNSTKESICGVWKMYKEIFPSGSSSFVKENEILEISENETYESTKFGNGTWATSFGIDGDETVTTLTLTETPGYAGQVEAKSFVQTMVTENGANYLQLKYVKDGMTYLFLRQQ